MLLPTRVTGLDVSAGDLDRIRDLVKAGLLLQAHRAAQKIGDLASWQDAEARILASKLASGLGAPRLSEHLTCAVYRANRHHIRAVHQRASDLHSRGAYRAWKFLEKLPDFPEASVVDRADLLAFRARVLGDFRDFQRADETMDQALALAPDNAWVHCERAWLYQAQDNLEAALTSAERSLELRPALLAAVGLKAELLQLSNRDEEALTFLRTATATLESGHLTSQLAGLLTELERHEEALHWWQKTWEFYPLAEPRYLAWMHGELSDSYYHNGQLDLAREHAQKSDQPFYRGIAERLEKAVEPVRTILPVPFVRQHHLTCAPATLSVLSQYWNVPVDHTALAAEICYEGTYDHVERHWAQEKGFLVREFTVSWELTRILIDRGIPFALNTVETTSAHLQAIIGYDSIRETLLLREPSKRVTQEAGKGFLEQYLPFGPRGMLMIPLDQAHRLHGVALTDAESFDALHRLRRFLEQHHRASAASEYDWLKTNDPHSRLTFTAQWELAAYDADANLEREAIEALLALYPECGNLLWRRALVLHRLGTEQEEYRRLIRQLANGPAAEPVFRRRWGYELGRDGRCLREARRYLLLALRSQACNGDNLAELANSLWDERLFAEATQIYRFAACQTGGSERHGRSYFLAARHVRRTDEALQFLRDRFGKSGAASVQPTRALFFALSRLRQDKEAFALLDEALALRPNDGELLLFAADEFARTASPERADRILEQARGVTSRGAWLRTAATMAGYRCDHAAGLQLWREILDAEPLAIDAQRQIAVLLGEREGRAAAVQFIAGRVELFPHYEPLLELSIEWSNEEAPEHGERLIRHALEISPNNAWAHRELATNLVRQKRFEEALTAARESVHREPSNVVSHQILSYVLRMADRKPEAAEAARTALRLSVDSSYAMSALFRACSTFDEKKAAVDFVRQELVRQVVFGEGVSSFREEAYAILGPEPLLAELQAALKSRPDLWQTWISVAEQLVDMNRFDEALPIATEATRKFPLLPRCWYELSTVHQRRLDWAAEIEALQQALALNPAWSKVSRALADVHERRGDFAQALVVIDQAVAFAPLESVNHGYRANILWLTGEREAAIKSLQQAIRLDPGYRWGWDMLALWPQEMGAGNLSRELALELTESRAGEVRSWMRLAENLGEDATDEKLAALDRATAIDPRDSDIYDHRAIILATAGRYEDAEAACEPEIFGRKPPYHLRGRLAWVRAQRGNTEAAIRLMRQVVKEWPDYYWGWNRLADWLTDEKDYRDALQAARQLERLAPRASTPQGYIGDLQRRLGHEKEAWEAFRRAFSLDPNYAYAGYELFTMQVNAGSLPAAEETLERLHLHHPGARTDSMRIRLACRRKQKQAALDGLRKLCFTPERTSRYLQNAAADVREAGWSRPVEKLFRSLLNDPQTNRTVGILWMESFASRRFWALRTNLKAVSTATQAGLAVRFAYLKAATTMQSSFLVRRLLKRDGPALRGEVDCWGQGGYALYSLKHFHEVVAWMSDWREQENSEPWMLYNLGLALRSLDDNATAHAVNLRALQCKRDHITPRHQLFLAWDEALAGHIEAADSHLEQVSSKDLTEFLKVVRALTTALITVLPADASTRAREFQGQKLILRQEKWKTQFHDPILKQMGRHTVQKIAQVAGQKSFRLGGLINWWQPRPARKAPYATLIFIGAIILLALLRSCSST